MADTGNPAAGRLHSHHRRVIVVGGSLVGLIAANLFHRLGWEVAVFERTTGVLEGRGAGITVLPGLVEGFIALLDGGSLLPATRIAASSFEVLPMPPSPRSDGNL